MTLLVQSGDIINDKYKLIKLLGKGSFGFVFLCEDILSKYRFAIKLESFNPKRKKAVLRLEYHILKLVGGFPGFCECIDAGVDKTNELYYIVMKYLGESLYNVMKHQPKHRVSLDRVVELGILAIRRLQILHQAGFIHRDIKPSNLLLPQIDDSNDCKLYLIDFGLARRYCDNERKLYNPRDDLKGLRGTPRYASLNAHKCIDLSRRDDLWSLFYTLLEMITGRLPWSQLSDQTNISNMKYEYRNSEKWQIILPDFFQPMQDYLDSLSFDSEPDYDYVINILKNSISHNNNISIVNSSSAESYLKSTEESLEDISKMFQLKVQFTPINNDDSPLPPSLTFGQRSRAHSVDAEMITRFRTTHVQSSLLSPLPPNLPKPLRMSPLTSLRHHHKRRNSVHP